MDDVLTNTGYSLNHPSKVKDNNNIYIYTAIDLGCGLYMFDSMTFCSTVIPCKANASFGALYHFSGALAVKLPAGVPKCCWQLHEDAIFVWCFFGSERQQSI